MSQLSVRHISLSKQLKCLNIYTGNPPMKKSLLSLSLSTALLCPLLTANTLEAAPRIVMAFLGDWSQDQRYNKGDVVSFDNALYQSLKSKNKNNTPSSSITFWRKILGGGSGGSERLPSCDLPGMAANLIGCDFTDDSKLRGKDLRGAQLIKAKLSGDLGVINLEGANLNGATLGSSDDADPPTGKSLTLQGGTSQGNMANLRGTDLSNSLTANGFPIQAAQVDFTSANLTGIYWMEANLEGAWMSQAKLTHAQILGCNCSSAKLSYADLSYAVLWNAKLIGADLYGANLTRAQLSGADLSNADFSYVNMAFATLIPDEAGSSNLAGANFTGADLSGVNFTDATGGDSVIYDQSTRFDGAICPDGSKVNGTSITTCQGHGFAAPQ
jgi:uncharacterized protein YjbI with pentapeptide repeats